MRRSGGEHSRAIPGGAFYRWLLLAFFALAVTMPGLVAPGTATAQSGCNDVYKGLVRIRLVAERKPSAPADLRPERVVAGNGTGFAVRSQNEDIFIVTAAHVVEEPDRFLGSKRPNYELTIEAKDCSEHDVPIELEVVRSGLKPDAGQETLDVAVLKVKNADEKFGELAPFWLAWIPSVSDSIPITVYGFPQFDGEGTGMPENEISIAPDHWNADGPEARANRQLGPGMSGAPIRDAATGHVIGIAITRQQIGDGSGALLFRGAVKDFVETHANLTIKRYHSVKHSVERVYVSFVRRPGHSDEFDSLLDSELPAMASEFGSYADASDDDSSLRWFTGAAEHFQSSPPANLTYADAFFTSPMDEGVTSDALDASIKHNRQIVDRLKRSLFVKVYVDGDVRGDSGAMTFVPHIWYVFDTGNVLPRKLDAFTVRLIKGTVATSSAPSAGEERRWEYSLGRLTVSKALMYRLARSHLVDATIEAEVFCTLTAYAEEGERAARSALLAMTLKTYTGSIEKVGTGSLPVSLFASKQKCDDDLDEDSIGPWHRQNGTPPLAVRLSLYDLEPDNKRVDFYGRHAWTSLDRLWARRSNIPKFFKSFGENERDLSCDDPNDKRDFCQLLFIFVEELNSLIYDEFGH